MVLAGRPDCCRFHLVPNATEIDARLDLRTASDALAAQDADRYGVDHPGLCPEEVRGFPPSASADVPELRFAHRLVLRPRDAPLTAHPAQALPEQRLPAVALRTLPRDARLALLDESGSVQSERLAPRAQVSLRTPVSLPVLRLASLRAQRWQALARQPELRVLEQHQRRETLQAWPQEPEPLQSVLPEREPRAWAAARQ
jgi:hypothetical protein